MALVVDRAHELGIHAIVTVFSVELVERAQELKWDAYKSASPDVINRPLLEALAATGNPLIVSTGASTLDEVVRAVGWLDGIRDRLAVLQCVSCYPAWEDGIGGVRAIQEVIDDGIPTGYSDHTPGLQVPYMMADIGSAIVEKHVTHDRNAAGPDHEASLPPEIFEDYVGEVKYGHPDARPWHNPLKFPLRTVRPSTRAYFEERNVPIEKVVLDCERDVREVSRQSLATTRRIYIRETLTHEDLTIKRPGTGIEPFRLDEIIGRRLARGVEADMPLREEDLA